MITKLGMYGNVDDVGNRAEALVEGEMRVRLPVRWRRA